jgi:hypothetical protein
MLFKEGDFIMQQDYTVFGAYFFTWASHGFN